MSEDKELVEIWRNQFIELSALGIVAQTYEMDRFLNREVDLRWRGFLLAKRTQPIVVLPEGNSDGMVYAGEVNERLTAAGIKYTIGE